MVSTEKVRADLLAMKDDKFAEFTRKLIPTTAPEKIIGVRAPLLRAYAKGLRASEVETEFLNGLLISNLKDPAAIIDRLDAFLPFVDNWATCDAISPKNLAKNLEVLAAKATAWLKSDKTYTVRCGVNMFMQFFLGENFKVEYAEQIAAIRSDEYYVRMGVAWYFATALAKNYEETLPFIAGKKLDIWTHNKTIQKAIESFRVTEAHKAVLRIYKIKNN